MRYMRSSTVCKHKTLLMSERGQSGNFPCLRCSVKGGLEQKPGIFQPGLYV